MPAAIKFRIAERMGDIMATPRILAFGAIAFVTLVSPSYAGPCSNDIAKMQARIDAKVHAMAATGPTGRQVGASTHVQPTPRSIGDAEAKLGEVSAETVAVSDKPCYVRGPPIAPVTKTFARKHSQTRKRR